MNAGTDLRPILGAMLIASVVLIIVNAILFSRSRVYEKGRQSQQDTPGTVAIILGIVGALAWTVVLWPVMTGSASGAYVIRVNGVVTSGGFLNLMYGLVPLFIAGLVLISLPLLIGRGLWNIRNKSADQKRAGKPGVGLLVLSIFALVAGIIFVGTVISFINSPGAQISPVGTTVSAAIGVVCIVLGIVGIARYIRGTRRG